MPETSSPSIFATLLTYISLLSTPATPRRPKVTMPCFPRNRREEGQIFGRHFSAQKGGNSNPQFRSLLFPHQQRKNADDIFGTHCRALSHEKSTTVPTHKLVQVICKLLSCSNGSSIVHPSTASLSANVAPAAASANSIQMVVSTHTREAMGTYGFKNGYAVNSAHAVCAGEHTTSIFINRAYYLDGIP